LNSRFFTVRSMWATAWMAVATWGAPQLVGALAALLPAVAFLEF
jgi:hypothetical protein